MAEPLLRVEKLMRRFGGIIATDHVSLDVAQGELHAVIGPNGAGKTTLISQLTGHLTPHSGSISLGGRDITRLPAYRRSTLGLARSFQITSLLKDFTAADNVALATKPQLLLLDEPMAGLGVTESARMVKLLGELRKEVTIVLVEHDMEAVFALADRISVLVYGRVIASGAPGDIRQNEDVKRAYLGDQHVVVKHG